jgi:hypothetical protein
VSGLHLYCLLPAGLAPAAAVVGIDGVAVEAVPSDQLACWVSRHDGPPDATTDSIQAHNAVVMAAMSSRVTPVPLRFGQWLEDAESVCRSIATDAPRWLDLLHRFAGHAEYGVRIARTRHADALQAARDVHPRHAHTGKEYMAVLARRYAVAAEWKDDARRIADDLLATTGDAVTDSRVELPAGAGAMVSLALLVPVARVAEYHETLRRFRSRHDDDLRFLCTGPWPPYSFVA